MASSDELKRWLVEHFQSQGVTTREGEWKRQKKHKDARGQVRREFAHPVVGTVGVVETPQGWFLEEAIASTVSSGFHRPSLSSSAMASALELLKEHTENTDDCDTFFDELPNDPRYLEAYPALPALFRFCFPCDTYENPESEGMGIDQPVGELCILLEDIHGEDTYLSSAFISQRLRGLGMDADDEYHWRFPKNRQKSVRDWVKDLLALGLVYDPETGDEGCLFKEQLVREGASAPVQSNPVPKSSTWEHRLTAVLAKDEDSSLGQMLQEMEELPVKPWDNNGRGQTWVEAAFERRAYRCLALLLISGAPIGEAGGGLWETMGRWRLLIASEKEHIKPAQDALIALARSPLWEPEKMVSLEVIGTKTFDSLERDAWAQAAIHLGLAEQELAWLQRAWDTLAQRVGQASADESFVHAWLSTFADKKPAGFILRCVEAVEKNPAVLDGWPERKSPSQGQALVELMRWTDGSKLARAADLAQRVGLELPSLQNKEGKSILEVARHECARAHQNWEAAVKNQAGRVELVKVRANGTYVSRESELRKQWNDWQTVVEFLEEWKQPSLGKKPSP